MSFCGCRIFSKKVLLLFTISIAFVAYAIAQNAINNAIDNTKLSNDDYDDYGDAESDLNDSDNDQSSVNRRYANNNFQTGRMVGDNLPASNNESADDKIGSMLSGGGKIGSASLIFGVVCFIETVALFGLIFYVLKLKQQMSRLKEIIGAFMRGEGIEIDADLVQELGTPGIPLNDQASYNNLGYQRPSPVSESAGHSTRKRGSGRRGSRKDNAGDSSSSSSQADSTGNKGTDKRHKTHSPRRNKFKESDNISDISNSPGGSEMPPSPRNSRRKRISPKSPKTHRGSNIRGSANLDDAPYPNDSSANYTTNYDENQSGKLSNKTQPMPKLHASNIDASDLSASDSTDMNAPRKAMPRMGVNAVTRKSPAIAATSDHPVAIPIYAEARGSRGIKGKGVSMGVPVVQHRYQSNVLDDLPGSATRRSKSTDSNPKMQY